MLAVIELTGAPGSGKTTIANLLAEALAPADVLFIDASPDQALMHRLLPQPSALRLSDVFGRERHAPGAREALDWTFSDLTVPVGGNNDLLIVGVLPEALESMEREKLRYGLSRLMTAYDYVIVDGLHPLIHALLPEDMVRILDVLTPEGFAQWRTPIGAHSEGFGEQAALDTPTLLLNQYGGEPLPEALEKALAEDRMHLIGKIPRYATPQDCQRRMPMDFHNGLLRLNIPFISTDISEC